jgi:hypothetical protein
MNAVRVRLLHEEYYLGRFLFPDDTPLPLVLETLRPAVLRTILKEWYQFPDAVDPNEAMECEYFYIGRSQDRYQGRSRLKVTYRLRRPPATRPHRSRRDVSRRRSLYCWIGPSVAASGGLSLFLGRDRPSFRSH